ncbi:MAG: ATP-dependent Clp protease proteolytic subunit, partial [Clostridia bacterium]|nr:ATP-dependent Clp protease proteolytic subunit [Clostridia bacterium]
IFLDEATQLTEFQMKTITACLRGVNDFPKRIYYTCNPGGAQGKATDISIVAEQIIKIKRRLNEILSKRTGQPVEKVEHDTELDNYMDAQEAKAYGIIDEVIVPRR